MTCIHITFLVSFFPLWVKVSSAAGLLKSLLFDQALHGKALRQIPRRLVEPYDAYMQASHSLPLPFLMLLHPSSRESLCQTVRELRCSQLALTRTERKIVQNLAVEGAAAHCINLLQKMGCCEKRQIKINSISL